MSNTSLLLIDSVPGGAWGASNSNCNVSGSGSVEGISVGLDTIVYVVSNVCGNSISKKPITVYDSTVCDSLLGANHLLTGSGIRVFPNPAQTELHISIESLGFIVNTELVFFDLLGHLVAQTSFTSNPMEFNTSLLKSGSYLMQINNGSEVYRQIVSVRH